MMGSVVGRFLLRKSLFLGVAGLTSCFTGPSAQEGKSGQNSANQSTGGSRPNIILIMADDLGYGDLGGFYGGRASTPNLNRLAEEGMLFTDFHSNGPMCSPTRAALLTGRYQQRMGIESALPTDWDSRGLGEDANKEEITMAEYLRRAGYTTGIFGKWHLGKHITGNPLFHGFDEFRGLTCGCSDYFSKLDRNGYKDWWHNDKLVYQEGYITDVITQNSIEFIEKNRDKPFFLYVAHLAIHFPWQSPDDGDLEIRREGEDFTSNYPGPGSKLGPHPPEKVPATVIEMVETLDKSVGLIMETLREQGLAQNTLVFFTSDNGGYLNYPVGMDVWPDVGSNGPLRGQKTQVYEGGHRVPAIAWWPRHIAAGSISEQTVMTFDLLPTFMELLDIQVPPENSVNAIDGVSMLSLLLHNNELSPRTLFWRINDRKAVRNKQWKLVVPGSGNAPELYNLDEDIGESNNLVARYPEIAARLQEELLSWEENLN
jgi:arylsulfatase A